MLINYKWKNLLLSSFIIFFFLIFFTLGGVNIFNKGVFDTKHNLVAVYFIFVGFLIITSTLVFLWEKRSVGLIFFKAFLVIFIISLLYSLISIGFYFSIYNIRLEPKPLSAKSIIFLIIELLLLVIGLTIITTKYVYLLYSVSMKENLGDEFINKYAWFLILKNINVKIKNNFLYLKSKENNFILEFIFDSKESIIIQFEGEEEVKKIKKVNIIDKHDFFDSMEKNNINEEEKDEVIINKISANNFGNKVLTLYNDMKIEENNVFVLTVFEEFSHVRVQGNVPEWYYWNDKETVVQYIKKLMKVNKK